MMVSTRKQRLSIRQRVTLSLISIVMRLGKTDVQSRFYGTILTWFLANSRKIGVTVILVFHCWTIFLAFKNNTNYLGIVLTAILPILSEIYWIYQLYSGNDLWIFYFSAFCIVGLIVLFLFQLEKIEVYPRFWEPRQIGKEEYAIIMAKDLIRRGFDNSKISQFINLSEEELEKIRNSI
jgi:hypothetical protein